MEYEIHLRRSAQKGLDTVPKRDYPMVAQALSSLGKNPRPTRVKKLGESGLWRTRVGNYRIVYAIDDAARVVVVVRVVRRKEGTYKRL